MDFSKFTQNVDLDKYAKDIENASTNTEYAEIPEGEYVVTIDKIDLKTSKTGKRYVSFWMKIASGASKGSYLFYSGFYDSNFGRSNTAKFLSAIQADIDESGDEVSHSTEWYLAMSNAAEPDLRDLLLDLHEEIDGLSYNISYTKNNKGFAQYEVLDVYE